MITVKLSNKVFYTLIFITVLALAGIGVYSYTYDANIAVPDPGHKLTEIQGYATGDTTLKDTIDNKLCQSDGKNCVGMVVGGGSVTRIPGTPVHYDCTVSWGGSCDPIQLADCGGPCTGTMFQCTQGTRKQLTRETGVLAQTFDYLCVM